MKQKCWQNLLFGASFINWSNSLRWYVLPQAFETIKLGFLAVREDHWHRPCLEIPVCVHPGAVWHHTDGDRLGARPACLFQAADEDIWEAAFHPQFPCPFANMNSSGNLPTHHAERGQCLGCPCHSYSWLRLSEAAVSCQKERSGWGKYIGGPGKPHPFGSSARCICGSQGKGPTSST